MCQICLKSLGLDHGDCNVGIGTEDHFAECGPFLVTGEHRKFQQLRKFGGETSRKLPLPARSKYRFAYCLTGSAA